MREDPLSRVPSIEQFHCERDSLSPVDHYWMQSLTPQDWFRIHCDDSAQIQSHGSTSSLPVKATQYRKVNRGMLDRLLRKGPTTNQMKIPLTHPGKYDLLEQQQKARAALLLWANQVDVSLDQVDMAELFGKSISQTELANGMRLVWEAKSPLSPEQRKLTERVREIGDRLIRELSKYGEVVADLHVDDAQRICICIKHRHVTTITPTSLHNYPENAQPFVIHQNCIKMIFDAITEIVPMEMIQFFDESMPAQEEKKNEVMTAWRQVAPDKLMEIEDRCLEAGQELESCSKLFNDIELLRQRSEQKAVKLLTSFSGKTRFARLLVITNRESISRYHGLLITDDYQRLERDLQQELMPKWLAQYGAETCERLARQWIDQFLLDRHRRLHPFIIQSLAKYAPAGNVAVMILGGAHFISGTKIQRPDTSGLEEDITTCSNLSDMRVIVVEPKHFNCEVD